MRVCIEIPNHAELVARVLDGLIEAGRLEIESGAVDPGPPEDLELIEDEDEMFQLPSQTAVNGGDCEDVSIWRAASLRASGEDEEATVQIWQTGSRDLHCVVLRSDGSTEDVWGDLRDGTWRLGFGLNDLLNPIEHAKQTLRVVSAIGHPITGGGPTGSPRQVPKPLEATWTSAPATAFTAQPAPAPAPAPIFPPGYSGGFGGIPTAPAGGYYPGGYYPGGGYPGGGYPGGGYPGGGYGDPYAGIPYYDGDEEDIEEDDDAEERQELREELAELRGELRGQRHGRGRGRGHRLEQADDAA